MAQATAPILDSTEADLPRLSAACPLSGDAALQDFGPLPLN